MIPRSKSAPKPLVDVATLPPSGYKLIRSQTALSTPLEAREDPFSLTGFFPSYPTRGEDWDWIRSHEEDEEEGGDADDAASMHPGFSVPLTPRESEVKNISQPKSSSYDEIAKQVIDGEDKFGMLVFSSDNFPSLLRSKMPTFESTMSPVHVSPLVVDEPLDLDALHTRLCSRREAIATSDSERRPEIGQLFFSAEEEKKDESGWTGGLYARLVGLFFGDGM